MTDNNILKRTKGPMHCRNIFEHLGYAKQAPKPLRNHNLLINMQPKFAS